MSFTEAGEFCIHKTEMCNCSKCLWAKLIKTEAELERVKAITPMESNLACRIVLLEDQRDALKVECAHREMEEHRLLDELQRVNSENEWLKEVKRKWENAPWSDEVKNYFEHSDPKWVNHNLRFQYDALRSHAGKMAHSLDRMHDHAHNPCLSDICFAKVDLAAYRAFTKGDGK